MTRAHFPTKLLIVAALAAYCSVVSRGLLAPAQPGPAQPGDEPPPATVVWQGHTLREVTKLADLPSTIQSVLHVGSSGIGGVADRGGNYNSTDFVNMKLPMSRFAVAGVSVAGADKGASTTAAAKDRSKTGKGKAGGDKSIADDDIALVALEHGWIALRVEVTLYSNVQSKPVVAGAWTIQHVPKTLRELVDQLDAAGKKPSH